MAHRRLKSVLHDLRARLHDSREIVREAGVWISTGAPGGSAIISQSRREQLIQLAFLQAFLAWEGFLEDSFVLYLTGQVPPKGRPPARYAFPPSLRIAEDWLVPEGRRFAEWTNAETVSQRARRFFRAGKPFSIILSANQNILVEANVLRNAIAHQSGHSQLQFEKLVRQKHSVYTHGLTVGGFLNSRVPGSIPPAVFFDVYLEKLELAAHRIVPA